MKKLLHLGAVDERHRVVSDESTVNDLGVRIPLRWVHSPDYARVWDRAIGGDDEAAARHAALVARRDLCPFAAERSNAFRGKVEVVCFRALIFTPDIHDPLCRQLHVHGGSVNVMALPVGRLRGNIAIEFDDRPVQIGWRRRRQTRVAIGGVGQVCSDKGQVELGIPLIFPEVVLVQVIENAVLAASDEVASSGDQGRRRQRRDPDLCPHASKSLNAPQKSLTSSFGLPLFTLATPAV